LKVEIKEGNLKFVGFDEKWEFWYWERERETTLKKRKK